MSTSTPPTYNRITTNDIALCPDALEYLEGSRILACACYQLDTSTSFKSGSLDLYKVDQANIAPGSLSLSSSVSSRAIFDVRWRKQEGNSSECAVVTAGGGVCIYRVCDDKADEPCLEQLSMIELDPMHQPSPISALYVNWLDRQSMTVAMSNGVVSILSLVSDSLSIVSSWAAHSLGGCPIEVWVTESDPRNPYVVWTGADDSLLKGWDTRSLSSPLFASKAHSAGVTSIKWNPFVEHVVATGSYDECLRIWDERYMSKGPVSELPGLGGGIWRLKWHPLEAESSLLAAACMLGGVHVIDALGISKGGASQPRKIVNYTEHKSLVYAAEWIKTSEGLTTNCESKTLTTHCIASCSFYEKQFHTWSFEN